MPAAVRPLIEADLPDGVEAFWFASPEEAARHAPQAEVAWLDDERHGGIFEKARGAGSLRWFATIAAGVEHLPLDLFRERGVRLTNGAGVNAGIVAEFAVASLMLAAKRLDRVATAHARGEWLRDPPGRRELDGSRALIVGLGSVGRAIAARLEPMGVRVTGARRRADDAAGVLGEDGWWAQLGRHDWVILAAPATPATRHAIAADELAAMRRDAWLFNVARGRLVDTDALVAALHGGTIGGAVLDVTDPEPLPTAHPLWTAPNALVTMHLAGRAQSRLLDRGAGLFLRNLRRYLSGEPLENLVDLDHGY